MSVALFRLFLRLFGTFPLDVLQRFGRRCGVLLYRKGRSRAARITRTNLAICFPRRSATELDTLTRQSLEHESMALAECCIAWTAPLPRVLSLVVAERGREHLDRAVAAGRGLISISPHLGGMELTIPYFEHRFGDLDRVVLFRSARRPWVGEVIKTARRRSKMEIAPIDFGGIRAIHRVLAKGGVVILAPDQVPAPGKGEYADFFGRPAYTSRLVTALARSSGAAVVAVIMVRLGVGEGFECRVAPVPPAIADPDTAVGVRELNAAMERCITPAIAQYAWTYKRFKESPSGIASPY